MKCVVILALSAMLVATTAGAQDSIRIAASSQSVQPGGVLVFTAATDAPLETLRVRAFTRNIAAFRLDTHTWQALLGVDLDAKRGSFIVAFDGVSEGHPVAATTRVAITRRVFRTRKLTVAEAYVNPPPTVMTRITSEASLLEHLWTQSAPVRLWDDGFLRPVPGQANSAFGSRSIFNGEPRAPHGGADFLSPSGAPILAPGGGRIVLARDLYFTGNTVVIDHGLGVFSLLAHMSVVDVQEGATVSRGDKVGEVGATGRVTGPHLHWAVRMNDARVDPLAVLDVLHSAPASR